MQTYEPAETTIAEVLLDQRVMCGVGNVYRCELLWACEFNPWARVGDLSHDECREVVHLAHEMLRANLQRVERVTAPSVDGGLAVYGRQGKTCNRCHDVVRVTHHGEANRVLYWCAGCQTVHTPAVTTLRRLHQPSSRQSNQRLLTMHTWCAAPPSAMARWAQCWREEWSLLTEFWVANLKNNPP